MAASWRAWGLEPGVSDGITSGMALHGLAAGRLRPLATRRSRLWQGILLNL
jgi:hypothetical protein